MIALYVVDLTIYFISVNNLLVVYNSNEYHKCSYIVLNKFKLSALAIQLITNQKGPQIAFINQEELFVLIYAMKNI